MPISLEDLELAVEKALNAQAWTEKVGWGGGRFPCFFRSFFLVGVLSFTILF